MSLQVFCQPATIQSLSIQTPLYMCVCFSVCTSYTHLFYYFTMILPVLQPALLRHPARALFGQEGSTATGFGSCDHVVPPGAHISVFSFCSTGRGSSAPSASPAWRAGWEQPSSSSRSGGSGRVGRARMGSTRCAVGRFPLQLCWGMVCTGRGGYRGREGRLKCKHHCCPL